MIGPENAKWHIGSFVQKVRGSSWRGKVVGFYSTTFTPIGYVVESLFEPGSVQAWPEVALTDYEQLPDGSQIWEKPEGLTLTLPDEPLSTEAMVALATLREAGVRVVGE